jgi:hypothetical protein
MMKKDKKKDTLKLDKAGNLNSVLSRKVNSNKPKKEHQMETHTITSSKKSVRASRYSNVNIAMLNSMRTNDSQQGEDLEATLSKQTKLEERVSILTIKRTMICFFAIIFSVPFFISTTYKSYLSEFVPIANMIEDTRALINNDTQYMEIMAQLVLNQEGDYDALIALEGPLDFKWEAKVIQDDVLRDLELVKLSESGYTFTVDLRKSLQLYSICGICGYVLSGILLVGFVLYINK